MCYFVLSANALGFEVFFCLELVGGWQEHLLMIFNQVDVVLFVFFGIDVYHVDCAFKSWSLSVKGIMTDVNLGRSRGP